MQNIKIDTITNDIRFKTIGGAELVIGHDDQCGVEPGLAYWYCPAWDSSDTPESGAIDTQAELDAVLASVVLA